VCVCVCEPVLVGEQHQAPWPPPEDQPPPEERLILLMRNLEPCWNPAGTLELKTSGTQAWIQLAAPSRTDYPSQRSLSFNSQNAPLGIGCLGLSSALSEAESIPLHTHTHTCSHSITH